MCGIAGIMTADGTAPDASVLSALQAALAHRGLRDNAFIAAHTNGFDEALAVADAECAHARRERGSGRHRMSSLGALRQRR